MMDDDCAESVPVAVGRLSREQEDRLRDLRFFSTADADHLLPYLTGRQVAAGEILWQEGQRGDSLGLMLSGHLEAKKDTEFPGKQVVVAVYGPGAVIGELSFLNGGARAVSVVALEDAELVVLTRKAFDGLLKDHPELGFRLCRVVLKVLASRLKKSYERLAAIF
jgi:CRP-like cAMP-binding protein